MLNRANIWIARWRGFASLALKRGAAINPGTPLSSIEYVHEQLDFVLVMTVNPGFAGQKMAPASLRKIADCRTLLDSWGCDIPIQVDGNVSFDNVPGMVAAGAANLVAGTSSLFAGGATMAENMRRLEASVEMGLSMRGEKTAVV